MDRNMLLLNGIHEITHREIGGRCCTDTVVTAGVTKERLVEAKEINKSLTALGDVISALSSGEEKCDSPAYLMVSFFTAVAPLTSMERSSIWKAAVLSITYCNFLFATIGESFIPYRNHKLTQVMSDSLGGTAKTLMFVNISPADYNTDETVTSLMYASRVKLITNEVRKLLLC